MERGTLTRLISVSPLSAQPAQREEQRAPLAPYRPPGRISAAQIPGRRGAATQKYRSFAFSAEVILFTFPVGFVYHYSCFGSSPGRGARRKVPRSALRRGGDVFFSICGSRTSPLLYHVILCAVQIPADRGCCRSRGRGRNAVPYDNSGAMPFCGDSELYQTAGVRQLVVAARAPAEQAGSSSPSGPGPTRI